MDVRYYTDDGYVRTSLEQYIGSAIADVNDTDYILVSLLAALADKGILTIAEINTLLPYAGRQIEEVPKNG